MQASVRFCDIWSVTLFRDSLDSYSWSDSEDESIGLYICKNLKMTLY